MTLARVQIWSPNYSSRKGAAVTTIVLHTAEGATTIESLGSWFANPASGVSSHVGIDDKPNTVGEYVERGSKAWTASDANPWSVQAELCAFAAWSPEEWAAHPVMLENCAAWVAEEAAHFGIPLVALDANAAQDPHARGVCQHNDLGAMGGGHWDCGPGFPIDDVLAMAAGNRPPQPKPPEEQDMAAPATCVDSLDRHWVFFRGPAGDLVAQCLGDGPFSLGGKVTDGITAIPGDKGTMTVYAYVPEPKGEVWAIYNDGGPDGWNTGGGWWRAGP
jgi:hypothetical protein